MPFLRASTGLWNSTFSPLSQISPPEGRKFPAMILMSVDLPAPLSHIRPSTSPASMLRSTPDSAWMAPKFLEIPRSSNRRTVLLSGPDDAFLQNQITVQAALTGGHHRE